MKNNRSIRREGFTLVELLIVIVVIGILSAMMMLSSTEAVSSARASNIVSNLRNLKTAALSWYIDNISSADTVNIKDYKTAIVKYLSNQNVDSEYGFVGKGSGNWYVYYDKPDSNVATKLISRKDSVGLVKVNSTTNDTPGTSEYTSGQIVGMFIR